MISYQFFNNFVPLTIQCPTSQLVLLRKNIPIGIYYKKFIVTNRYYRITYKKVPVIKQNVNPYENFNQINIYDNNNIYNKTDNEEYVPKYHEHLRGLVNIASTCYMNSTIQCFAHIGELFAYFQKDKIKALINAPENDQKLFPVFAELITYMWDQNDMSPLQPYIFKEKLGQLNPLFKGALPNDAKDLLTFMLMQLHDELNHPINNNNNMNVNMIINSNMP